MVLRYTRTLPGVHIAGTAASRAENAVVVSKQVRVYVYNSALFRLGEESCANDFIYLACGYPQTA